MLSRVKGCVAIAVAGLVMSGCSSMGYGVDPAARSEYRSASVSKRSDFGRSASNTQNFPSKRAATGKNTFVFDPVQTAWAGYDAQGNLVRTGEASGGSHWCADVGRGCKTSVGHYAVYRKGGPGCVSSKFPIRKNGRNGGAPIPYCMFFKGGMAVHGSNAVPNHNASHGCVRVPPADAEWLHNSFLSIGSHVIVQSY